MLDYYQQSLDSDCVLYMYTSHALIIFNSSTPLPIILELLLFCVFGVVKH